ncbi:MAG: hypothetical protein ACRDD1_03415, partial [Planctomycetia bacterium]
ETGYGTVAEDEEVMPFGRYRLAPGGANDSSRQMQLGCTKDGVLRGTHYDNLSESTLPVHGAVDKKSRKAAFTIGESGHVVFDTTLDELMKKKAVLIAHHPDGHSSKWTLTAIGSKTPDR